MKHQCPCYDNLTLKERGCYDICPVCFWEDDGQVDLHIHSGPNHMTLSEGRENYKRFGAMSERFKHHVRPPKSNEIVK